MKNIALPLALLGASSLLAMQPKQTLTCEDRHDSRRAHHCEIREQTVSAAGGPVSIDSSPNGGISVKGWDRADVLVRSKIDTTADTEAEAQDLARRVQVNAVGAQIKATGPQNEHEKGWSVSYEVFVPSHSPVSLHTVNGGLSVTDVSGGLEFQSVNGGVSMKRVNGKVNGKTVNGGVNIEFSGDRWTGEGMDITTTNGGISLKVPQTFSAQLQVDTHNGGISSDFAMNPAPTDRRARHISTAIGSGGSPVHLTTTNGGVSIKRI